MSFFKKNQVILSTPYDRIQPLKPTNLRGVRPNQTEAEFMLVARRKLAIGDANYVGRAGPRQPNGSTS